MIKNVNIKLYKNKKLELEYNDIKSIVNEDNISFNIDSIKTIISKNEFIRENNEYRFYLNITEKKCTYLLKEKNMLFDIEVEKINYKEEKNNIILEYKINTDEKEFKLVIEGVDNNE